MGERSGRPPPPAGVFIRPDLGFAEPRCSAVHEVGDGQKVLNFNDLELSHFYFFLSLSSFTLCSVSHAL